MDERTAELIMICKKKHDFGKGSHRENIAKYMADRCFLPVEYYTDDMINEVILTAAYDYIDSITFGPPSEFLKEVKRTYSFFNDTESAAKAVTWYDAICMGFANARVRDRNGIYVNGFTESNTKFVTSCNKQW